MTINTLYQQAALAEAAYSDLEGVITDSQSPTTRIAGGLRKAPKRGYWLVEIKFILTFIMIILIFHILPNRFLIESNRTNTVPLDQKLLPVNPFFTPSISRWICIADFPFK